MRRPNFHPETRSRGRRPLARGSFVPIAGFFGTVLVGLTGMVFLLPAAVVLPALSLWSFGVAAIVAAFAWLRPGAGAFNLVTPWDVAGAFTLVGCAAAMLGEVEAMVEYLSTMSSRSEARD